MQFDAPPCDRENFLQVERQDPTMAVVHLAAALIWLSTFSISKSAEGLAFAILLLVAVLRLPRTHRLYAQIVRAAPFIALVALSLWQSLSVLWSEAPKLGLSDIAARQVFACLALWPLMSRWKVLLGAFIAGAVAFSALAITANLWHSELTRYIDETIVHNDVGPSGLIFAVALAALVGQWRASLIRAWLVFLPAALLLVGGIVTLGQRMPFLAGTSGALFSAIAPTHSRRIDKSFFWRTPAVIVTAMIAGNVVFMTTGNHRHWIPSVISYITDETADISPEAAASLTSHRAPLAEMAIDIWKDHPLIGAGAGGFSIGCKSRIRADPNLYGGSAALRTHLSKYNSSHNAFLDEASQRGVIGAGLLLTVLISCGWWAWQADPSNATLGMLAVWIALSLTTPATARAIPLLILALIVTRCSYIAINRRWLP